MLSYIASSLALLAILFAGCDASSKSVAGVDRSSPHKPKFVSKNSPENDRERAGIGNELLQRYSFVNEYFTACFRISVSKLNESGLGDELDWAPFESELSKTIGIGNAKVGKIEEVWVLLSLDDVMESTSNSATESALPPFVYVVELKEAIDDASLQDARESSGSNSMEAVTLDKNRIALGPANAIGRVQASGEASSVLIGQIDQWNSEDVVSGAMELAPLRDLVRPIVDMSSQLPMDVSKSLAVFESLQQARVGIGLAGETFGELVVEVEDGEAVKDAARSLNKQMQSLGSGGGFPGLGGMGGGFMEGGDRRQNETPLFESESATLMAAASKEIVEEELFSVVTEAKSISIRLGRLSNTEGLLKSLIQDLNQGWSIVSRTGQMQRIATALKGYEEKYGVLPPAGLVTEQMAAELGIPVQFNWRVGILPFLDEQSTYDSLDFSLPWDDEKNAAVMMPAVFGAEKGMTCFRAATSGGGLFAESEKPVKLSAVTDNPSRTALILEFGPNGAEHWLSVTSESFDVDKVILFDRARENGIQLIDAEFNVRILRKDAALLANVLTPSGDDVVERTDFIPLLD